MSANPQPRPLVEGDLDLLISRSLDGDLPPAEERELRELLAADPSARARYEAMARLVGRLEALPDPDVPFALGTRVNSQVEADSQGLAATLHRFGFYFRPATLGVIGAGVIAVGLAYTLRHPPEQPAETVAAARQAPADERVSVFLGPSEKKEQERVAAPQASGPAVADSAAESARNAGEPAREAGQRRDEPVLVASAEEPRARDEAFAPEPLSEARPAAPAPAALAESEPPRVASMQKSAGADAARARSAPASAPLGATAPAGGQVEIVGRAAGTLRLTSPARLDGLSGPFEGSYRLDLDASGRVTDVARLFGGSGTEPSGLTDRLKTLSFSPPDEARTAGSVDVRVRIR